MDKIYVFGSIIMDHTTMCHHVPRDGESVFGNDFYVSYGGKGINQAMMLKRLKADVTMVGAIGNDNNGEQFLKLLKSHQFDMSKIFIKEGATTGISNIIVDEKGQNRIIVVPGANYLLSKEDILSFKDEIPTRSIFLISNEIPLDTIKAIINMGKEKEAMIILNPAPYKDIDKETLDKVYMLTPNENEAADLFKLDKYDEKAVCEGFDKLKCPYLIVTLGDKGSILYDHKSIYHQEPYKVKVVDTVGAGDAFNGGLTYGMAEYYSLEDCLKLATICSSIAIQRKGALVAQPSLKEVADFYHKHY